MSADVTRKTHRVKVRVEGYHTYEIDTESEKEARAFFSEGVLVYDDTDFFEIESVVQIDTAEEAQ